MIDVIGTEEYLTKIDRRHTIGFSVSYVFSLDLVYIHEQVAQRQIQTMILFDFRRGSLRAELAVTCTRIKPPLITSTSVQQLRDSDRSSSARAGDTNGPPARQYLPAVLGEMIPMA